MTNEEKNLIKEEIREEITGSQNGIFKKIIIGVITMVIAGSIGSFLGVITAQKIDRERIRYNSEKIENVKTQTFKNIDKLESDIESIKEDQLNQWKYILEITNTRGSKIENFNYDSN